MFVYHTHSGIRYLALLFGILALAMIGAAVVAQIVPSVMRRRPMEERTFMPHVVNVAAALALMIFGILSIPGASIVGSRL